MTAVWPVSLSQRLRLVLTDVADLAVVATDSSRVAESGHGEPPAELPAFRTGIESGRAQADQARHRELRGLKGQNMERFLPGEVPPEGAPPGGESSDGRY